MQPIDDFLRPFPPQCHPPVPIRWLLVKGPNRQFPPQALLSTDRTITPQQMLTFFIQRWTVETTFEQRTPIWVWKRNGRGMTKPLRAALPWYWLYSLWWRFGRIPSSKKQPVASDKRLGIAKQNPLSRMHSLGCENTSGNIFQGQFHTQTSKNQQRESSNALSISFAILHEWIKSR